MNSIEDIRKLKELYKNNVYCYLDEIISTFFDYKNKYPDTKIYKRYTTIGGIVEQINEQKNGIITIHYLCEINIEGVSLWEVKTSVIDPDDIKTSFYLKWYNNE